MSHQRRLLWPFTKLTKWTPFLNMNTDGGTQNHNANPDKCHLVFLVENKIYQTCETPHNFTALNILFIHNDDTNTFFFGLWCLFVHTFVCRYTCIRLLLRLSYNKSFFLNDVSHYFLFSFFRSTYLLWGCIGAFATVLMWKSEDNLQEKVLSFYHVVLRYQAWQQMVLPTEASHQLIHLFIVLSYFFFETGSFHWLATYQ